MLINHLRDCAFMALSKKLLVIIALVVVAIVVLATVAWMILTYNGLVAENEKVDSQWAQVQNQYQRKIDLIPTLVQTASAYQQFEASTLANITALRTQWMESLTNEDQVNVTNQLDAQLATIIVTYEAYPELQSITIVRDLFYELAGTENRIATERMRYNEYVQDFNAHLKSFPASYVASWGDFEEREYYESPVAPPAP